MRRTFYQRNQPFLDRLFAFILHNPVLERGLVLAPIVVAAYNVQNALILGVSFALITFITVFLSSLLPQKIPYVFRVIFYALLACAVFVPTAMMMDWMFAESVVNIGVFLPLLVANSLIVVKSETRFHQHPTFGRMIGDLFSNVLGFLLVILLVGLCREWLANGFSLTRTAEGSFSVPAAALPFTGFFLIGLLAALVKKIRGRLENPRPRKSEQREEFLASLQQK